ncbi:TlpA family protein disulfide reductase, partial [bacterium]|nr:TlpA family protein disulfide reductase [bacterium]
FSQDNLKMVRIREWKKAGEHLLLVTKYMGYYAVYKNHPDDAYKYFKEGAELGASWLDYSHLAIQAVRNNKIDEAKEYTDKYVDTWIRRGAVRENSRKEMTESMVLHSLIDGRAYDAAISHIKNDKEYDKKSDSLYNLAIVYVRKGSNDKGFEYLYQAVEQGFCNVDRLKNDPDFKTIQDLSEWKPLLEKVESKWAEGSADREKIALRMKIDKPAADWELKDPTGKTYKLSSYKGKKVVILDFWATWCGPCIKAMPELDKWTKNHKPDNVEVFSINTWERDPDKAKKLFIEKKYAMILLIDGDSAAKEYGVTGIPYICIVGKDGKIKYEVKGFSPELEKNLTYWVKDLLK